METRRLFKRQFDITSRHLFYCRQHLQRTGGDSAVDWMSAQIGQAIANAEIGIDKRIEFADKIIKKENIVFDPACVRDNGQPGEVVIIDPLAKRYIKLMEKADLISQKLKALWLDTALSDTLYGKAKNEVKRILEKACRVAQDLDRDVQAGRQPRQGG